MSGACDSIRFVLDGRVVEARDAAPTTTLLQYLRETLGRTGTKEGCAEGDCGACTVILGELDGERIAYRPVNSCIRFLPTVDGKSVITVESLRGPDGSLHPVQRAMLDYHASQCGFCTPGFVMSLFGLYLDAPRPRRAEVIGALSGNLCRCTGYRPIIDAGCCMADYPEPLAWSRRDAQSGERRALLDSLRRGAALALATEPGYHAPMSLDELARLYEAAPHSLLLAGGTDVGLWVTKQLRELPPLIYLGEVAELKRVREADGIIGIGAAVALTDAFAAIVARYPMLAELAERFGSPPIRNSGTLCGNLANGSPIGDVMPVLIALGASVLLRRGGATREMALDEFYAGYRKTALAPGELVAEARIPVPRPGRLVASYKVGKRFDQDISAVCGGYAIELRGGTIASARIAYGGMAAVPQRARRTEAALAGRPWSEATMASAAEALALDFRPITDMRAGNGYRLQVAGNLLRRFYLEHRDPEAPSRIGVFARTAA
ncbi:MAG: xanthine dehydrogenase small subunit [Betaproteobacteria bacterium]|nr:xanthine dehydrogenase small subunit [Betaproteobacteria bacterium]